MTSNVLKSSVLLVVLAAIAGLSACTVGDDSPTPSSPAEAQAPEAEGEIDSGTGAGAGDGEDEAGSRSITMALSWGRNKMHCTANGICTLKELGRRCPHEAAIYIPEDRKVVASVRLGEDRLVLDLESPPPSRETTIFIDADIPLSECASRALGAAAVVVRSGEYVIDSEAGAFGSLTVGALIEPAEVDPADAESAAEAMAQDLDVAAPAEPVGEEGDVAPQATKHCFCRASMNAHGGLVNWGSLSDVCLSWQIPLDQLPGYKWNLSKTKKESLCNTWCSTQAAADANFNDDAWVCANCRPKADNPGNMVAYSKIGTTWPATSAWSAAQTNIARCCPVGGGIQCPEGWLPDGNGPGLKKCKRLACMVPEPCPPMGSPIGVTAIGFPPKVDVWGFTWGCGIWQWGPMLGITPVQWVPCESGIVDGGSATGEAVPEGPVPTPGRPPTIDWTILSVATQAPNPTPAGESPSLPQLTREPDFTAEPRVTPVPDATREVEPPVTREPTREPDVTPVPEDTVAPPPPTAVRPATMEPPIPGPPPVP